MTRKDELLKVLRERLEVLDKRIISHEPWADQTEFEDLIQEAKYISETIKIVEAESDDY